MMSNLEKHARMEFRAAGWTDDQGNFNDEMQEAICKHVLELLKVFADEGHSGTSAPYTINLFKQLAMFEPIVPLTGEDWEWCEVHDGVFQNKRCGHVFKQADRFNGQAYDGEAVIFWDWCTGEETGERFKSHFTSRDSAQPITFPYTPKREYKEATND
jgi:hypothetical protein